MVFSRQGAILFPIGLFIFIWILQILLYVLSPYAFEPVSSATWFIILVSISTVIIGYLTYYFRDTLRSVVVSNAAEVDYSIEFNQANIEKLLKTLLVLVCIGVFGEIGYLVYLVKSNDLQIINLYWYRYFFSGAARGKFGWDIIHSLFSYLILLDYIAVLVSGIYYVNLEGKKKLFIYGPILLAVVFSIITLQRNLFLSNLVLWFGGCLFMAFFIDERRRRQVLKNLLRKLLFLSLFIVFILFFVIGIRFNIDLGGASIDKLIDLGMKNIYCYVSGNIVALDQYLNRDIVLKEGSFILESILKWLSRIGIVSAESVPSKYLEFIDVGPIYMNTYTYIRDLYDDFGMFGLLPFSYTWGVLTSLAIHKLYQRFRLYKLMFASLMLFSFFISFFTFYLHNLTMVVLLFLFSWIADHFIQAEQHS